LKWIKTYIRLETIKLPEENISEKPHDISLENEFMNMAPKT
jgi:hypothetical protein